MTTGLVWLIMIGLIAAAALMVRRADHGPPVTRPSCAKCRYAVAHLPTTICPECGSDLRIVGVLVPGRAGRRSFFGELATMTMAMLVLSVVIAVILGEFLPQYIRWNCMVVLQPQVQSQPTSQMFFVSGRMSKWMPHSTFNPALPRSIPGQYIVGIVPYASGQIQFIETSQGLMAKSSLGAPTYLLAVDTETQTCHEISSKGAATSSRASYNANAVTAWLRRVSPTEDAATATSRAEALVRTIQLQCNHDQVESFFSNSSAPAFLTSGGGLSSGCRSDKWLTLIGFIVAGCIWLAMVYLLALGHRRKRVVRISRLSLT